MYWDDDPCEKCSEAEFCDGWEAQFCCTRCNYIFHGEPPCDDCDPWDI